MIKLGNLYENNGFTLLEILLVILITGILVTAVGNIFTFGFDIFLFLDEKAETQKNFRFLTNYINENVKYSSQIYIYDDFNDAESDLASDQKLIALNNSEIVYQEYGNDKRNIIELPITTDIHFSSGKNTEFNYLVLNIEDAELNIDEKNYIILNNINNYDDIDENVASDDSEPEALIIDKEVDL
ncbi:MAG: prepilin-type N-terminal cleavage/methylation domain-containing protein [bacterium]